MPDLAYIQSPGGHKNLAVAAGAGAADVVVSAKPGRLCRICVTAAGTAAFSVYDNATQSSGAKLIFTSPTTPAAGDQYKLDIPLDNGVVVKQASGSAAVTISFNEDGVSGSGLAADNSLAYSEGGQYAAFHAAGATGASASTPAQGRICRVIVLTLGTAATPIYDNASAASGTKVFVVPASPAVGTVYDLQMPVVNGIYVGGATNTSALLVTYTKNTPYAR